MSTLLMLLKQTLLIACISIFFKADPLQASSPKYPFASDFRAKALSYTWENMKNIGLILINNNITSKDSLEIRLYFNASEEDLGQTVVNNDTVYQLGARLDLGIIYDQAGFQKTISDITIVSSTIAQAKPRKIPGTGARFVSRSFSGERS